MGCGGSKDDDADKQANVEGEQDGKQADEAPAPQPLEDEDSQSKKALATQTSKSTVKLTKAQENVIKQREEAAREEEKKRAGGGRKIKTSGPAPEIKLTKGAALARAKKEEEAAGSKPGGKKPGAKKSGAASPTGKKSAAAGSSPTKKKGDDTTTNSSSDFGTVESTSFVAGSNPLLPTASLSTVAGAPPPPTFTDADFQGFQLLKTLGRGSFGTTYECGLKSCRTVCCKVIEFGAIEDHEELDQLQVEISLMKKFQHPNIVQYYGCMEDAKAKNMYIFMEYVTGGSLNSYLKKFGNKVPLDTARNWTAQMLRGVNYLHEAGVIHRDIKGANILVTNDGVLKLADFGCSKSIDEACSRTRGCSTMVGTPYWMAPEVLKSEPYGTKADIWSVGCTIIEMITGEPAWPLQDNMWAAVYKIANSTGLPPGVPKNLPADMKDFLDRCFERAPSKRASASELLKHRWLKGM